MPETNFLLYDTFDTPSNSELVGRAIGDKTWISHALNADATASVLAASQAIDASSSVPGIFLVDATDCGADVSVRARIAESSRATMLLARFNASTRDGYCARYLSSTSRYQIGKFVAGTFTSTEFILANHADGALLELRCVGSTISFYVNDVLQGSITDSTFTSAGHAGLRLGGASSSDLVTEFSVTPYISNAAQTVNTTTIQSLGWHQSGSGAVAPFTDDFTVSVDTLLAGRTSGALTWISHALNANSLANILNASDAVDLSSSTAGIYLVDTSSSDYGANITVAGRFTESTKGSMLLARFSPTVRSGYAARYLTSSGQYEIGKWTTGTYAVLYNLVTSAPANGALMEFRCDGTALTLLINGVSVLTGTDSTYASAGHSGFRMTGATSADILSEFAATPYNLITTQNTGSYILSNFDGTYLALNLVNPTGITGYLWTTLDDVNYKKITLRNGTYTQPVFFSTSDTSPKTIKIGLAGNDSVTDNWTTPTNGCRIASVISNGNFSSVSQKIRQYVVVGDSIARGRAVQRDAADELGWAPGSWPYLVALDHNADIDFIAFSGQGFNNAGAGNVPAVKTAINSYSSGRTRSARSEVDIVFVAHGTNDGSAVEATLKADATTTWAAARTLYPNAKIIVVLPLGYSVNSASPSAVSVRDTRNGWLTAAFIAWADANSQLIDMTGEAYGNSMTGPLSGGSNSYTTDLIHPNQATNVLMASYIGSQFTPPTSIPVFLHHYNQQGLCI